MRPCRDGCDPLALDARQPTVTWKKLRSVRPDLAEAGRELLYEFGVGLAFLATVRRDGGPRVLRCPLSLTPAELDDQQLFEFHIATCTMTRTNGHGDPSPFAQHPPARKTRSPATTRSLTASRTTKAFAIT